MAALIDVNVLVALMHARHRHSADAVAWLQAVDGVRSVAVCRVVQMGALRVLTNPAVMREDVMTAGEFWRGWDRVLVDDRFHAPMEPAEFEAAWRSLTSALPRGRAAGTDSYLAAFAKAGGYRLTTFDRGFGHVSRDKGRRATPSGMPPRVRRQRDVEHPCCARHAMIRLTDLTKTYPGQPALPARASGR